MPIDTYSIQWPVRKPPSRFSASLHGPPLQFSLPSSFFSRVTSLPCLGLDGVVELGMNFNRVRSGDTLYQTFLQSLDPLQHADPVMHAD